MRTRQNKTFAYIIIALGMLVSSSNAAAEGVHIKIQGRESIVTTKSQLQLSDLAEVSSPRIQDDEVILALNKIEIATSPEPGQTSSLSAHNILEKLEGAGVKLSDVGYVFPRVINIKRAARSLSQDEVQRAISEYVQRSDKETSVRSVTFKNDLMVAPDAQITEVLPTAIQDGAQQQFILTIKSDNATQKINVTAAIDRWIEVAVIRRPIARGRVIETDDVTMARLNVKNLPTDAIIDPLKVIGLETKRNLNAGDVLQQDKFDIPAVINSGEKVTLRYRSAAIEATATGVSLEAAGLDKPIRVKNEASNKVVSGIVRAPGIVEVR